MIYEQRRPDQTAPVCHSTMYFNPGPAELFANSADTDQLTSEDSN